MEPAQVWEVSVIRQTSPMPSMSALTPSPESSLACPPSGRNYSTPQQSLRKIMRETLKLSSRLSTFTRTWPRGLRIRPHTPALHQPRLPHHRTISNLDMVAQVSYLPVLRRRRPLNEITATTPAHQYPALAVRSDRTRTSNSGSSSKRSKMSCVMIKERTNSICKGKGRQKSGIAEIWRLTMPPYRNTRFR